MAAAMLFTACDDSNYGWDADPLSSPEEAAQTVSFGSGSVTEVPGIKLGEVTESTVQVCKIVPPVVSDKGTTTTYEINLGDATYTLSADGKMSTAELTAYVENHFGKAPVERTIPATVTAYVDKDGQTVSVTSSTFNVKATPDAPVLSTKGYYLVGSFDGWDASNTAYSHDFGGADPYTNSVITITVPANENGGNIEFKVLDLAKVGSWDGDNVLTSVDGAQPLVADGQTQGRFTDHNKGDNLIVQEKAGSTYYIITLDLINQTWTAKGVNFGLWMYMAGDANGWSQVDYLYGPAFDGKYVGFMYLNQGGFKFCTQQDWNGTNYGENMSTDGGAGNIVMSEPEGYYKVDLDLAALSYKLTAIKTIGIIGEVNGGGWATDTPLTYNKATRAWEVKGVKLTAGEFKFRANGAWDINWGGSFDALTQGGGNLKIAAAGTYDIQLFAWCDGKAYCTVTKK